MPEIIANISEDNMRILRELAEKRGLDANTVLQQAIQTEDLLSRNVGPKDEVLIKGPTGISKVEFG